MKTVYSILFAALIVALLYLGYSVFQSNTATLVNEQHKIDSLTAEVHRLDSLHVKEDSTITVYKDSIVFVDKMIEVEKTKYIQLKHKIDEVRTRVVHYTPGQLDSFFSNRYSDSVISGR
jgi:peptidoglycan hydrolase CwlO-like protein